MFAIPVAAGSLFRHRPFALFWLGRLLSQFGYQMQAVAIGWQVYALTDSPLALGLVGLVQYLPIISLVLVVGHVADRYDRRITIPLAQLLEAVCAVLLVVGAWHGWSRVEPLFAIILAIGAARAFESPAMSATLPGLVGDTRLQEASAWSASANQTATIMGPAAGGLLYAFGSAVPFAVAAACLALRRDVFLAAGGFDATHLPIALNDLDLCLRLRTHGYRILWTPFAELHHLESASRGSDATPQPDSGPTPAAARFHQECRVIRDRWGPTLDSDPFYNPAFSRADHSFQPASQNGFTFP